MTEFELGSSGIGSDPNVNCTTTTTLRNCIFLIGLICIWVCIALGLCLKTLSHCPNLVYHLKTFTITFYANTNSVFSFLKSFITFHVQSKMKRDKPKGGESMVL